MTESHHIFGYFFATYSQDQYGISDYFFLSGTSYFLKGQEAPFMLIGFLRQLNDYISVAIKEYSVIANLALFFAKILCHPLLLVSISSSSFSEISEHSSVFGKTLSFIVAKMTNHVNFAVSFI